MSVAIPPEKVEERRRGIIGNLYPASAPSPPPLPHVQFPAATHVLQSSSGGWRMWWLEEGGREGEREARIFFFAITR